MSDALLAFPQEMLDRSGDEVNYLEALRAKSLRTSLSGAEARALTALEDMYATDEDELKE
jgi:hypothetical protein